MIALDLDGTILDYSPEGPTPRVNPLVLNALGERGVREVAICTNQGGLPWHVMGVLRRDGRPYPSPEQFCLRLRCAIVELSHRRIAAAAVRVSVHHPKAPPAAIERAARLVRADLGDLRGLDWTVYTTARARKPEPLMLKACGATEYWGDSPEDGEAALAAGVPFVRVERFFG